MTPRTFVLASIVAASVGIALLFASVAFADDGLALGRVCASECGLTCSELECAAIASVLRNRPCRGCSLETVAHLYSRGAFDTTRTDERAWVALLDEVGHPLQRETYRSRWRSLLATARLIVAGSIADICDVPPLHWGCRHCGDPNHALRAGWVEAKCGDTVNAFYGRAPQAFGAWAGAEPAEVSQ